MDKKKFNISNYFNGKLFIEAFKQTRIVALIFFVCLSVAAIFMPIYLKSEYFDMYDREIFETLLNICDCMYPLLAVIFVATPIMYIVLFSFQTKRNASDFYHSLPVKRSCQFISFIAAILSWVLIITTTYALIFIISANITSEYFVIDYSVVFCQVINMLICSAIVIGVFSIGTSLTGTLTSNIISSFGILIIPRFIIMAFVDLIVDNSMTLVYDSEFFIFNSKCNIAFSQLLDTFLFENNGSVISELSKYSLYSIILAIVYIVIGLKLFVTRPSEIATKSFRNKKIFSVLKYGTGFLISLILVIDIYDGAVNFDFKVMSVHLIEYILIIVAIGLSMFALEAAFFKSIKSGLKTILATPFILLLDVVIIFGASAITNYCDNEHINPDNVDYVYVEFDYYYYFIHETDTNADYFTDYGTFENAMHETKITDQKIIDFLLSIYNSDRVKKAEDMPYHGYHEMAVTFDSTFGDKTRYIYLTDMEYNKLANMLLDNKDILKCLTTYPEDDSIAIICMSNFLTVEQNHTLYQSLRKEVKDISDRAKTLELFNVYANNSPVESITFMNVEYYHNGKHCSLEIPITPLTPDTYTLFIEYGNTANKGDILDILNNTENVNNENRLLITSDIRNLLPDGTSSEYYDYKQESTANNMDSSFTIIKDYIKDYYLNNKTLNYNDLISGEYYLATIRLLYNYDNHYDFNASISGVVCIPIPKDSPLIKEIKENDILDGDYDIEVEPEDSDADFEIQYN